jgi:hypothetical protein
MAELLKRLGKEALTAQKHSGVWYKAAVSAKNAAKLRKEALLAGSEWPYEQPEPEAPKKVKLKGHKHDKLAAKRQDTIKKNLEDMPKKVAQYRASRKLKESPILQMLTLTPKQRLMKQYRETK